MNTTAIGRTAESAAATYLENQGLAILDRNWRNRWCEIDIVARDAAGTIHFAEVKYRRRTDFGAGYEFVNYAKANRLRRAALAWVQAHHHAGGYQIDVVSITGDLDRPDITYIPSAVE
jgi:putative endonuclease